MELNENTMVKDLIREYPWIVDEAIKIDERFKMINSPIGKMLLKKATIKDLCEKGKISPEMVIPEIQKIIASHQE